MKKTQVSRARPGAHGLSKKIAPQSREEAGTPWDRQLARAGLSLPGEPRGCEGGWCGVRVRATQPGGSERSGSDERESVSSLEPQQLSLELSVGNCISPHLEGSVLWLGSFSYHGKACHCTGDVFPWIPGDYETALHVPSLLARTQIYLCSPRWARVQPRTRVQGRE